MARPQPLSLANSLLDDLNQFSKNTAHTDRHDAFVFRRLLADCERLQKTDVVLASLRKVYLYSTTGNFEEVSRWLTNAERNGGQDEARIERLVHLVNHGFASDALVLIDQVFKMRCDRKLMDLAEAAAAIGAFTKIVDGVAVATVNNEVLQMTNLHALAVSAAGVMQTLGVTDSDMTAMIDVAGEHLRANKLLWQSQLPDFTVLDSTQGGSALAVEFRIDVSPKEAVRLGWSLTEALLERGLDRPGVHVDFLGTALPARVAA